MIKIDNRGKKTYNYIVITKYILGGKFMSFFSMFGNSRSGRGCNPDQCPPTPDKDECSPDYGCRPDWSECYPDHGYDCQPEGALCNPADKM